MNEEVQLYLEDCKEKMTGTIRFLEIELSKIRAGKASPNMLDGILIDFYGVSTPLAQASTLHTPDPKTLIIQPWDKNMIDPIEKAIMAANIGMTPVNNGEVIRLVVPALTEERRKDMVKKIKSEGESAKVAIRNSRRDTNDEIKQLKKDGLSEDLAKDAEIEIQKITDDYIKKVDIVINSKEEDLMKI